MSQQRAVGPERQEAASEPPDARTPWSGVDRLVRRLAQERTSSREVGLSVCLGVIVGTTPFWGLQTLICIVLATGLRLNRLIAVLASNYSIPPLMPFLAFAAMQIGRVMVTGEPVAISYEAFAALEPIEVGRDWLLGAPVLGLMLGAPSGLLAATAVSRYRRRAPASKVA